jgi:hypothetical protein
MDFANALKTQFITHPDLKAQNPQIWKILAGQPSGRRTRRIARMEQEASQKLGTDATFDWGSIDWATVLKVLEWVGAIMGIVMLIF